MKDVNNVHLVCRNLHQIANLHVNPKLRFEKKSTKDLASLVESSRIFEELEFLKGSEYLLLPEKIQPLEEYLGFTGPHIKKLYISQLKVDQLVMQNLLNLLPNLEFLELTDVLKKKKSFKWDLKPTKIKRIKMVKCRCLDSLVESLEKCAIRELDLTYSTMDIETLKTILRSQEKNLKKLTFNCVKPDFLADLKDLRLEYLNYGISYFHYIKLSYIISNYHYISYNLPPTFIFIGVLEATGGSEVLEIGY